LKPVPSTSSGQALSQVEGLALFGFVFLEPENDFTFIILCKIKGYVHFAFAEIGFVLHKSLNIGKR